MQEVTKYPHATFSWVDLSTTDAEAGKAFYTGLFGWTFEDMPTGMGVDYTMFYLNGKSVSALSPMMADQQAQGIPSHWNSYISVDNLEESTERVASAGGTVIAPPFDIMDSGRMAVLQDPTGAFFSLWKAGTHIGASLVNIPNTLVWNELATRDTTGAAAFYNAALGWDAQAADAPMPYTMFVNNGRMAGGMIGMDENWGDIPSHWLVYFAVADLDASLAKVAELGGSFIGEPQSISETDRFAVVRDPQGAAFALIYMANPDPMP